MPETMIGVGDLTVDILLPQVDRFPEWGQETIISAPSRRLGGNIGNMAVAAAALKGRFIAYGMIGGDEEGGFVRSQFEKHGLPQDGLIAVGPDGGGTSQTYACIRKDGERLFFTYPGVLGRMESLFADYPLPPGKIVFLSGWCLPPRVRKSVLLEKIRAWRNEGRWVAADLIWSDESWRNKADLIEALSECHAVFLNEDELLALTGAANVAEGAQLLKAFFSPERTGEPWLIVKQGNRGAAALSEQGWLSVEAVPVEAESTVGAGDYFNAAFLHALWNRNDPLPQCLRFACVFAGLSIDKRSSGMPGEREIELYMKGGTIRDDVE